MAAPSALLEFCWGKDNSGENLIRGSIAGVKNFNGKFHGNTINSGSSITFYGENSGQVDSNVLFNGSISIQNFSGVISQNSLFAGSFIDLTASSEVSGSISVNNLVTSTIQVLTGSFSGSCTNNDLNYSTINFWNSTRTINRSSVSGVPIVIDDTDINYSFIQVNQFESGFIKDLDMGTSSVYSGTTLTMPNIGGVNDSAWVGTFNLINSNGKNITNILNLAAGSGYYQLTTKFTTENGSTVSFTPTSIETASSGDIVMDSLSTVNIFGRSTESDYILLKQIGTTPNDLVFRVGGHQWI